MYTMVLVALVDMVQVVYNYLNSFGLYLHEACFILVLPTLHNVNTH